MRAAVTMAAAIALTASSAQAQPVCITTPEAEAMTLVALPTIIRQTGALCTARLPATSLLRQARGGFIDKFDAAADRAWPTARMAIGKLSDPAVSGLLESDFARPLLVTLVAPLIVGRIATADCPVIDRLATQLAPLPAANVAAVVVTTLRYLKAEKAKGRTVAVPDLPLCTGQ